MRTRETTHRVSPDQHGGLTSPGSTARDCGGRAGPKKNYEDRTPSTEKEQSGRLRDSLSAQGSKNNNNHQKSCKNIEVGRKTTQKNVPPEYGNTSSKMNSGSHARRKTTQKRFGNALRVFLGVGQPLLPSIPPLPPALSRGREAGGAFSVVQKRQE